MYRSRSLILAPACRSPREGVSSVWISFRGRSIDIPSVYQPIKPGKGVFDGRAGDDGLLDCAGFCLEAFGLGLVDCAGFCLAAFDFGPLDCAGFGDGIFIRGA